MEVRLHNTIDDLEQILHLQKQNHRDFISQEQAEREGYVTVLHDMAALSEICGKDGHVIALNDGKVIGYALTMHSVYAKSIPVLKEMVDQIIEIEGEKDYLIMGQLCVAKEWRGRGVVKAMYDHMKLSFSNRYSGIYTEVASNNPRSLRVHAKCGYCVIRTYINLAGKEWQIVYCDWY